MLMFFTNRNRPSHIDPLQAQGKMQSRVLFLVLVACAFLFHATGAAAATFTVNSPSDIPDINPGDGVCETAAGNGVCTLRAALQEANALPGADTIILQPNVTYLLSGMRDILDSVTIVGADRNTTIIDGNGDVTGQRVLQISKCVDHGTPPGGTPTPTPSPCDINNPNDTSVTRVTISAVTIQHGKTSNIGGGVINYGVLTLNNVSISNNTVSGLNDWGGGIYSSGRLTITNSSVSDNVSGTHNPYGGGIYNQGPMTISNSTISGNRTGGIGGGIFNVFSTATITGSTISGNTAVTGGGIYASSPLVVINSTISGNFSTGSGAGIYAAASTTSLFNVTITHNRANSDNVGVGVGGGVSNASGSTLTFVNSIIALNENVIVMGGPFPILNEDDCSGAITSQGNNIMYAIDPTYCTTSGTVTIADPNLGPLQNNGGLTQTHALLPGSPAIDAGNSGGCTDNFGAILTSDQRGSSRPYPVGGPCDIGAFEFQPTPTPTATPSGTPAGTPTPTPIPGQLGNISTRLQVETGDNVLIGGFIVTGTQPKKVILRAIGPSLPVAGALANPTLELHDPSGVIASNDNWMDASNRQEIIDSTVAPTNPLESAILMPLPANNTAYTAIVQGVNGGTGVGLVEAYDLDGTVDSRLANISTRGRVQTGDDVMIGGFIVVGQTSQRVIVRAIGPSLSVPGKLADPTLELHDANGMLLQTNDNWRTGGQEAEIIATTIPPSDDLESAIVRTLTAGSYTAIVRGVNGTTGVALVEVYALN